MRRSTLYILASILVATIAIGFLPKTLTLAFRSHGEQTKTSRSRDVTIDGPVKSVIVAANSDIVIQSVKDAVRPTITLNYTCDANFNSVEGILTLSNDSTGRASFTLTLPQGQAPTAIAGSLASTSVYLEDIEAQVIAFAAHPDSLTVDKCEIDILSIGATTARNTPWIEIRNSRVGSLFMMHLDQVKNFTISDSEVSSIL
ncbi:MAG: hypothetical protein NC342_07255 [Pseudoflavonifractor sp.]|nr:hypothetical protein [Alloprevotella sp.]MCM1117316.1 hypothetical protein [Pseudoflavonifractor sp.]